MPATSFVRARIDETIQRDAALVLAEMGLTISDVVRMTLTRVAKSGKLPFPLEVPNAETLKAMAEARAMMADRRVRFESADELFDGLEPPNHK